jgi:hypothetical protein
MQTMLLKHTLLLSWACVVQDFLAAQELGGFLDEEVQNNNWFEHRAEDHKDELATEEDDPVGSVIGQFI